MKTAKEILEIAKKSQWYQPPAFLPLEEVITNDELLIAIETSAVDGDTMIRKKITKEQYNFLNELGFEINHVTCASPISCGKDIYITSEISWQEKE